MTRPFYVGDLVRLSPEVFNYNSEYDYHYITAARHHHDPTKCIWNTWAADYNQQPFVVGTKDVGIIIAAVQSDFSAHKWLVVLFDEKTTAMVPEELVHVDLTDD